MVVYETRWPGLQEVKEAGTKMSPCHNCLAVGWDRVGKETETEGTGLITLLGLSRDIVVVLKYVHQRARKPHT